MENLSQAFQGFQDVWPSCVCAIVFLLLILWDVSMALRRRAHWVPCQALILTALTIQMLSWISALSDISYVGSQHERGYQVADLVKKHQLLFDCGRLMMCVFIGYLLPAMVRANWTNAWSDIGGLILIVLFRLAFEVYFVWRIPNRRQSLWFAVSNTTLFMASSVLSLLLSCAVLAGKTIRSLLLGKVHWVLSCCPPAPSTSNSSPECKNPCCSDAPRPCKNSCCSDGHEPCKNWCCSKNLEECENTENHVLKCWIVARVSQPEYIMARSVFSSLAGVILTIAVLILVVKWACIQLPLDYGIAHKITVFIELAFILVGWMVVSFRWLTAVLYFPRNAEFLLYLEDFWTQSIVELQADLDAQLTCRLYKEKIIKQRKPGQRVILDLITAVRLHSVLLPMRVWLQILMVSLSKTCWSLSQKLVGMIRPFIPSTQHRWLYSSSWRQFLQFKKALDFIRMPGERARGLWRANEFAFERTRGKMEQGSKKGEEDCEKLIQLIKQKKVASPQKDEKTKQKIVASPQKEDETYFNKMSCKRKAVSLMYCMVHFYEGNSNFDAINDATRDNIICSGIKEHVDTAYENASIINDAIEACSDAWDLLDFVDSSDNVGADKEFDNMRNMWKKHFGNLKKLKAAIKGLRGPSENLEQMQTEAADAMEHWQGALENWQGSKDWMHLTVDCNLDKKLYLKYWQNRQDEQQLKNYQNGQEEKPLNYFQRKWTDVFYDCLKNVDKVLIEKCNKWAKEGKDEEIYRAAFIAGKAKVLRDKVDKDETRKNPDIVKNDDSAQPDEDGTGSSSQQR